MCGVEALVMTDDTVVDDDSGVASTFVWMVDCECCSYTVRNSLGNASAAGLLGLHDHFE